MSRVFRGARISLSTTNACTAMIASLEASCAGSDGSRRSSKMAAKRAMRGGNGAKQSARFGSTGEDFVPMGRLP